MIKSNLLLIPATSSQFQASQADLVILETLTFCATFVLSLFAQLLHVHSHQEALLSPSILTFETNVETDDNPDSKNFRTELPSSPQQPLGHLASSQPQVTIKKWKQLLQKKLLEKTKLAQKNLSKKQNWLKRN